MTVREEIDSLLDPPSDTNDDSEAMYWELFLNDLGLLRNSEEVNDDSEPVRATGASTSSGATDPSRIFTVKEDSAAGVADKDNDYAGKAPDFCGDNRVNVDSALPSDYFGAIFSG